MSTAVAQKTYAGKKSSQISPYIQTAVTSLVKAWIYTFARNTHLTTVFSEWQHLESWSRGYELLVIHFLPTLLMLVPYTAFLKESWLIPEVSD
jgi:hypothetical protein